jgi:CBS domain-containing protein
MLCAIASGREVTVCVEAIGSHNVVTVNWNSEVAAAKAMNRHRTRYIVLVDDANRPTGVISMRDLVGERSTLKAILQSHDRDVFAGGD